MKIKKITSMKTKKKTTHKKTETKKKYQVTKKTSNYNSKSKLKTLRIITIDSEFNDYKNDMNAYSDIFKKCGYKIDIYIIQTDIRLNINYSTNPYYDINLFIDRIAPANFKIKNIFPSRINIFVPNINTFQNYKELIYIDIVLCNNKQCYNFINFIRKENKENNNEHNYTFKSYYTNFTTPIPNQLSTIRRSSKTMSKTMTHTKPMIFIHSAENQIHKNTGPLIHCWLTYNTHRLDCELHILCNGLCMTNLLLDIKKMYNYDLLNTYTFEKEQYPEPNKNQENYSSTGILKYKNLSIYLELKQNDIKYKELIKIADVALCPSRKDNYPHYINTARYFNIFVITMNNSPMNELITDNNNHSSGYLLKKSKLNTKIYKETKYRFDEIYPNIEELRDSIVWCLEHQADIKNYSKNNTGKKIFLDDKKYFENSIEKIIK
jgi:hypothetical protein